MLGAIAGDIIGSLYEADPIRTTDFPLFGPGCRFTDDTVLTVAVADALMGERDYAASLRNYARLYPRAGYGGAFRHWAQSESTEPYGSWGNGAAMRVSPVAWAFEALEDVIAEAGLTAAVTHNHPEGIRGAQAAAAATFLARRREPKENIRRFIEERFGYDLGCTIEAVRPHYQWDVSCQGTVPPAIVAFLDADGYEDAFRLAVSLGGDADTLACITGGIAEAYYGLPEDIARQAFARLDGLLADVVTCFQDAYGPG